MVPFWLQLDADKKEPAWEILDRVLVGSEGTQSIWQGCTMTQALNFIFNFNFNFIVLQLLLSAFSPHHSPLPYHPSHSILPPAVLVRGSFINVPWSFPFFPLLSPSLLPFGHCQFVPYFHISGSILLTCLFCWLGSTYRWDHMVFVFYHLVYFT